MKPYLASLIHAFVLILFGIWGYFGSENPSFTALIPVGIGIILLLLNWGIRKENRVMAHIAILLTFLTLIALLKPLSGAIGRTDMAAMIRVGIMMAFTLFALIIFIKSFVDARKAKL
ncbi:MAG: hypothetical protein KAT15_08475 [Bacteroidales bacterium]|nr:hypothetical protein [Bacteroidales bacterium]